jgi:hypothetical protein
LLAKILEKDAHNYKDKNLAIFPLMKQHKTTSISLEYTKKKLKMSPLFLSNITFYSHFSLILLHHWHHMHPQTRKTNQHHINPKIISPS